MIQLLPDRVNRVVKIRQIDDPTGVRIGFSAHEYLHRKRMPVQLSIRVIRIYICGELMRSFESELLPIYWTVSDVT